MKLDFNHGPRPDKAPPPPKKSIDIEVTMKRIAKAVAQKTICGDFVNSQTGRLDNSLIDKFVMDEMNK